MSERQCDRCHRPAGTGETFRIRGGEDEPVDVTLCPGCMADEIREFLVRLQAWERRKWAEEVRDG